MEDKISAFKPSSSFFLLLITQLDTRTTCNIAFYTLYDSNNVMKK